MAGNVNVMEKYRKFVADYDGGMGRADMCGKYGLREEDFDSFLGFLRGRGLCSGGPCRQVSGEPTR